MRYLIFTTLFFLIVIRPVLGQIEHNGLFDIPVPKKQDFDISIDLEQLEDKGYCLVIDLELAKDAYIISHFSKDSFYLNFILQYPDQEALIDVEEIEESPSAMEEFDPLIQKQVMFLRTDTRFKQKFKLKTEDNVTVNGLLEFLVEPSCIPYDILFSIIQRNGRVYLGDYKIKISEEYKR